jgi:microcin C transport system substrate-binding protein
MTRLLKPLAAALVLLVVPSCKKGPEFAPYDNTPEREAFYKRYNAELAETLAKHKAELETSLAGDLSESDRKEKQRDLDDTLRRLERPAYFEALTEEDLPKDLAWETNMEDPELGSPQAKKGGTFHTYIPGGAFPPNIRSCGREANNSFRSYHWDDIELPLTNFHPETGNVFPVIADKWSIAADGQTVYFHINDDAKWSDGREVTSGDWMMTFYVYLSKYLTEPFYRAYYGEQYWGIASYGKDYVCIRLATAKPLAAGFAGNIAPFQEEFYREFGPDFERRYAWRPRPTTGAYKIEKEDIVKGRSISLTRVQDWWARDKKYFKYRFNPDRIEYLQVRDEGKIFQMFLRGDIDTYLFPDAATWYEKSEVENVFDGYIEKASFYNEYPTISRGLYLNHSRPLLDNLDIRIGLQHATNWQKVIDLDLRGDAERLNLLEAGYGDLSHPTLRTRPFSVQLAREAFARAGFTEQGPDGVLKDAQGRRLSFSINYPRIPAVIPMMLRLKEEALRSGLEYRLEAMDPTASFQKTSRKEHEIAFTGFQSQLPTPDFYQGFHSKDAYEPGTRKPRPATNNISVFADPEVDKLLEENRNARSLDVIRDTSFKLEEIFHERATWVPAYFRPFYRVGYWRWVRWPDDFNVRLGNEPEMNHVHWIDPDIKTETLEAMTSGKTFPEKNLIFDQHRKKNPEN